MKNERNKSVMIIRNVSIENAAKTLHLGSSYGITVGNPADFIILDAPNFQEALNRHAAVLYSYRRGRKLAKTRPAVRALSF